VAMLSSSFPFVTRKFCFVVSALFFFSLRFPPRSPLFPYTTLFRSVLHRRGLRLSDGQLGADSGVGALFRAQAGAEASVADARVRDRKSTRLNSSHVKISYAVFCLKKKKSCGLTVGVLLLEEVSRAW